MTELARSLETVSPKAPMTTAALIMGLTAEAGRPVTQREISEAPAIPEGATRAEYAEILRNA
ncbi:hypothetical protein ACFW6E_08965 [Streptomyces olivaceoviridis]|uniref:hypothetical protein n=1 Tax=Streptomyces TaxID=1883 RepID=UPI001CEDB6CD|nr:hypothetical protein [Streptomyces spinosus]